MCIRMAFPRYMQVVSDVCICMAFPRYMQVVSDELTKHVIKMHTANSVVRTTELAVCILMTCFVSSSLTTCMYLQKSGNPVVSYFDLLVWPGNMSIRIRDCRAC